MNRTDRLYALVEELRAASPRPRSARWLAGRFDVSSRTIERDLSALQESGVPIYAEPGRSGGYVLDKNHTLPPLTITPAEATALAVGLHALSGTPFAGDARSALHKILAIMPPRERHATRELADRVRLTASQRQPTGVPRTLREALSTRQVLRLRYTDAQGAGTDRLVEPMGFLGWRPLVPHRLVPTPCRGARLPSRPDPTGERPGGDGPAAPRGPFRRRHPGLGVRTSRRTRKHRHRAVAQGIEAGAPRQRKGTPCT